MLEGTTMEVINHIESHINQLLEEVRVGVKISWALSVDWDGKVNVLMTSFEKDEGAVITPSVMQLTEFPIEELDEIMADPDKKESLVLKLSGINLHPTQ